MIITLDVICILVSLTVFVKVVNRKISTLLVCLVLFNITYVIPLVVEIFIGNADIGYIGFQLAQNDIFTNLVYSLFIIVAQTVFYMGLRKKTLREKGSISLSDKVITSRKVLSSNSMVAIVCILLILVPAVSLLLSPNPLIYIQYLGAFSMKTVATSFTENSYHSEIISISKYFGFIGIILLKLFDVKDKFEFSIIRAFGIVLITILDGKRTFFAFLLIILLAIDAISIKSKQRVAARAIISLVIIFSYFVMYSYLTGKYEYNTNWYSVISEYFFRSNSVKVAIYSALNPEKMQILEYPFQTFLYNLLYFIPRNIWPSKPYPYPQYYTSAVFGFDTLTFIGWYFQTGLYAEFISNIGIIGIFLGPVFIVWLCNVVDKAKSIITNIIGMFFVVLIQVFEYSDMFKIVAFVWIMLIMKDKLLKKKIRFKFL